MKRLSRFMPGRPAAVEQRAKPSAPATRPPLRGTTAGLTALATLVAAVVLVVLPAGPAQAAPLRSTPLITYNMQGAGNGQDSKWTSTVGRYIQAAEIVGVQEAGPTPPGVQASPPTHVPGLPQNGNAGFIQHHRWAFGHATYEVYFLQTDRNGGTHVGGRNNVALVTHRPADEVTAVPIPNGRAALGVRFGNDWYFTIHAQRGGGNAQNMVNRVANFVNRTPGRQWTVMGDFNRRPGTFNVPAGSQIYRSHRPTHQGGRELDYAVASARIPDHPVRRQRGRSSDHYAVGIGALRAAAEPRSLFTSPRHIENMQNGGVLNTLDEGTDIGTPISTLRRTGEDGQKWDLEFDETDTVRIRRVGGRCVEAFPDDNFRFKMFLNDCNDRPSQRWELIWQGNEQYKIRSVAARQCMDVRTSTDPELVDFRLAPCHDTDGQHWFLAPPADTIRGPNFETADLPAAHEGSSGLENIQTGRMLASDPGSANTLLRAYPHRTNPDPNEEEWRLEWAASNKVRLRDPITNRCATAVAPIWQPEEYAGVAMRHCNRSRAQTWRVEPVQENAFRLHSTKRFPRGDACLSLDPGPEDTDIANGTQCRFAETTQLWFFAPFSTTTE